MNLFSVDSKLFQFINQIVDCVILSMLWLITSIPIITIGASTTALYYAVNKVFYQGEGHAWKEYCLAFKREFKQATIMWLMLFAVYFMIAVDCIFIYTHAKEGGLLILVFWILMIFLACIMMWSKYWFPYLARFNDSTKMIIKNTIYMALFDMKWTLLLLVISVVELVVYFLFPAALMILPAACMIYINCILENIFMKYMSQEEVEAVQLRKLDKNGIAK